MFMRRTQTPLDGRAGRSPGVSCGSRVCISVFSSRLSLANLIRELRSLGLRVFWNGTSLAVHETAAYGRLLAFEGDIGS